MTAAIMNSQRSWVIYTRVARNWTGIVLTIAIVGSMSLLAGHMIRRSNAVAERTKKTKEVFIEFMDASETALMTLDAEGTIVKSNDYADKMFSNGSNIEGRNVHDFCLNPDAAARGAEEMKRWLAIAPIGTTKLLFVTAQTSLGKQDIVISARASKRIPGSRTEATATVGYVSQLQIMDARVKPPMRMN